MSNVANNDAKNENLYGHTCVYNNVAIVITAKLFVGWHNSYEPIVLKIVSKLTSYICFFFCLTLSLLWNYWRGEKNGVKLYGKISLLFHVEIWTFLFQANQNQGLKLSLLHGTLSIIIDYALTSENLRWIKKNLFSFKILKDISKVYFFNLKIYDNNKN